MPDLPATSMGMLLTLLLSPSTKTNTFSCNSKVFVFEKSGGFIGADLKYEKNLSELSSDERQKLEKLIADSGLLSEKRAEKITGGAADMYQYDFRFKDGGQEHHARFDDGTLPNSYRPIVQFLKDKMVDQRHR